MIRAALVALAALIAAPVQAQTVSGLAGMPTPAAAVPSSENTGGAVGSQSRYAREDHTHPRITRAANCTLDAAGSCSITWANPLSATPTIVTTPVNPAAAQAFMCNTTAMPTTTAVSIKCWALQTTTLSLAIVTAGLNLAPASTAPTGTVVQVIALPPTQ